MMHAVCCEVVQNQLEEFHDDELTLEQRVAIQGHLRDCVTCSLLATEFEDVREMLREAAQLLPDRGAPEAERLPAQVLERLRIQQQFSWTTELRALFQDMHLVWAALGATAAMLICIVGAIGVLHAATNQDEPDSLAGLISFLANPGSNENPVRLDARMLAPRSRTHNDSFMPLPAMPADDAVLALSAVVTREGRIQNLELLSAERALGLKVRPDVLIAMLHAASQVEFEPAKASTGVPVAVSMVWLLASTTVKGRFIDDVVLVRRPAASALDPGPVEPKPVVEPLPARRPATDEVSLL